MSDDAVIRAFIPSEDYAPSLESRTCAPAGLSRVPQEPYPISNEELERIRKDLVRAAFKVTRNLSASCDIAQDICAKLMMMPEKTLSGIRCLEAYLLIAAKNEARNWRRVESRRASLVEADELSAQSSDPYDSVCTEEELSYRLQTLPSTLRDPLVLCRAYGYTAQECGAMLGISVEAVWKRVHRAFEVLRTHGRISFQAGES